MMVSKPDNQKPPYPIFALEITPGDLNEHDLASNLEKTMIRWFEDYRWSDRSPAGVSEHQARPEKVAHFMFTTMEAGLFVEEYDDAGHFVRLCYTPQDHHYDPIWHREESADGLSRVFRDADGRVVKHEVYEPSGESCSGEPLMNGRIYNGDGRLLAAHEPSRVNETSCDIRVTDAAGKLRVVLHHSDMDRGEPVTIHEDWE